MLTIREINDLANEYYLGAASTMPPYVRALYAHRRLESAFRHLSKRRTRGANAARRLLYLAMLQVIYDADREQLLRIHNFLDSDRVSSKPFRIPFRKGTQ